MIKTNLDTQLKILLVGNFLSRHGHSRAVGEDLAEQLLAAGWQVLYTSAHLSPQLRLADMLMTIWREHRHYQVAHVDLFSGNAFLWAEASCWLLSRLRKPYLLTMRGGNLPSFARRQSDRVSRLLQGAAVVTTPSRYLLESMQPYRPDLLLLPNPLDLGDYSFRQRQQPLPRLIWLRAFHHIYNPPLAVRVLAALLPAYPDAGLIMVGPDKGDGTFQETQALAGQLGVAERVQFPGGVPKASVPDWLNRGDIFLNTTNVDNTPVSVLEAMACGLPVVSTDVGGIPYLLDHGHDALLAPPKDAEALAVAVRTLLENPDLAASLSANGRRKVEAFSWETILPRWQALFQEVAARG
jgi:glycosyltransferase involved in cell wall biosynthesis